MSLGGHKRDVTVVRYSPTTKLVFTVNQSTIKVILPPSLSYCSVYMQQSNGFHNFHILFHFSHSTLQ